eukprot:GFYU01003141.1.p1 GENE.GFYU01003141.1~~GFYU01003141.1.p1  ORF type:complete len:324 (-),score=121.26 GFYU01003141.1:118-963(-)
MAKPKEAIEVFAETSFGHVYGDIAFNQYTFTRKCVKSSTSAYHLLNKYPAEADFRLTVFDTMLEINHPRLIEQLINSKFLERVIKENFGDASGLEVEHTRLPLSFMKYEHSFAYRAEALQIFESIKNRKMECPAIVSELVRLLKRYRVVSVEDQRMYRFKDKRLQASTIKFYRTLSDLDDILLDKILSDGEIVKEVSKLYENGGVTDKKRAATAGQSNLPRKHKDPVVAACANFLSNLNSRLRLQLPPTSTFAPERKGSGMQDDKKGGNRKDRLRASMSVS